MRSPARDREAASADRPLLRCPGCRAPSAVSALLAALLASAAGAAPLGAQAAAADSAWRAGDRERAERLYAEVLAADSTHQTALLRTALLAGQDDDFGRAFRLLRRLRGLSPDRRDARLAHAQLLGWSGRRTAAVDTLQALLDDHPGYAGARRFLAAVRRWQGRHLDAAAQLRTVLEIEGESAEVRRRLAVSLRRAGRPGEAEDVLRRGLELHPGHAGLREELARLRLDRGRLDRAERTFRELVGARPGAAHRGLARVAMERGDLAAAERHWRAALEADPRDVPAMVGLARTLRWQGREGAAAAVLERARTLEPTAGAWELAWIDARTGPRLTASYRLAHDSDGNEMRTFETRFSVRPIRRLELRASAYRRDNAQEFEFFTLARETDGGRLAVEAFLEPGWTVEGGLGVTRFLGAGAPDPTDFSIGVDAPRRNDLTGGLHLDRRTLDYTAVLIRERVRATEVRASGRLRLGRRWELDGAASWATFEGEAENRRLRGEATLTWERPGPLELAVEAEAFGFEDDLDDGYYDPQLYTRTQLRIEAHRRFDPLRVTGEFAPGLRWSDRAGEPGSWATALRAGATVTLFLSPGRTVDLSASWSKSGFRVVAGDEEGGYEYYSFSVGASWVF